MLQKQAVNINFSQGLDTKTDPKQVSLGKFLALNNSVFTKGGLLQKRNGYGALPKLIESANYLTTFNGDLTAIGSRLQALSSGYGVWVDRGAIQPCSVSTLPLVRNNLNQSQSDIAIAPNGLVCTVYTEINNTTPAYKYVVADSVTGQNVIAPTALTTPHASLGTPRVFLLGAYFVIVYSSATANNLKYLAISTADPTKTSGPTVITTSYTANASVAFDAALLNNTLYIAWNGAASSGIKIATLTNTLVLSAAVNPDAAHTATMVSVTADPQNQVVWVSYYNPSGPSGYTLVVDPQLNTILAATQFTTTGGATALTSSVFNGVNTILYELASAYSYDSGVPTHFIRSSTVSQAGAVSGATVAVRSVGLASKAFTVNGVVYFLAVYQSPYQSTYFLMNGSTSTSGLPIVVAKLAYENASGYYTAGLPNVSVSGSAGRFSYLFKDLIQAVNKNTNPPSGSQTAGVYSQTGINLATVDFGAQVLSSEIGSNLNLTGGFLWGYDGYTPVENNFFLYPDSVEVTGSGSGGSMLADTYYYQVTYEWSDNQGNLFRSAPSIPVSVTTTGTTSSVTVNVPTLRLTYKVSNPVKIVIYRWSLLQQTYYQVTSITAPTLNDTTADSIAFVDTQASASIIGNNILYTAGGVVENVGPPSFKSLFLFDDRLFGICSEDPNLLWFSKQVIEATPVEMSDLFTMYIAPSLGAQGPSGPLLCGFPMDDKAILFKPAAISYFNGAGPDNTGASNQYGQPVLITSTLGCSNQKSIVFLPQGLMFEFASASGNQIWLLGRDLSTSYIGAPVESLTKNATVQSAVSIPGTNQVRFTMSSGITLMYDFYYGRWGTFQNIAATSSTLYQGLHTFINSSGLAFQETPGLYLDGANPVLMSFTTSWLNLAGLQGYQRAFWFFLLGQYITPHKLLCEVAYDYNDSPSQGTLITPTNWSPNFGSAESNGQNTVFGQDSPFGGAGNVEDWRIFLSQQRCTAIKISVSESYDPSYGVPAGAGLTLSGINLVYALKRGWRTISAAHSAGS